QEAAKYEKKVMVLDFVTPTPLGNSWGLGGTCVNVGCIPKKLMHQAALLGQALQDSRKFGWQFTEEVKHNWMTMTESVQNYIGSLNWGYRVALREKKVTYENAYGEFVGPHTVKKKSDKYKAQYILLVVSNFLYFFSPLFFFFSDDLFSLPYCPGKTLVVGASYVALECAGFLAGLGLDVTVMVRSILLRGFDQDIANKIGEYMEEHGINFIREFVPIKVGLKWTDVCVPLATELVSFTVAMVVVHRHSNTWRKNLFSVCVCLDRRLTGKIPVSDEEQTNVPYIYAVGDILQDKLELTPVAIQAGRLLVQRLYAGATSKCDYVNVPTTVFTPLEYGACGYSEEAAVEKFGEENIEVYHSHFWPLEWTVPSRDNNKCYAKIICNIQDSERVIGFHVLGPNAGEVTQGFAAAIKCGLTKEQLDSTIGIHPVCAEVCT
ncbi:Thioredoxin reductase 1, cytoplasmic, partial [Opisthocomus hoazin]